MSLDHGCTAARPACEACSPRFFPPVCLLRLVPRPPVPSPPPASLLEPAGAAPPAARCSPSPSPSPCACSAAPTVDTPKLLGPLPLALPHSQHGSGEAARGKAIRQASPMQGAMMGLGMVATPGGAATQFAVSAARSGSLQRGPGHKPRARDTGHPRHFARGTGRGRHVRAAPGGRHAASELDPPPRRWKRKPSQCTGSQREAYGRRARARVHTVHRGEE